MAWLVRKEAENIKQARSDCEMAWLVRKEAENIKETIKGYSLASAPDLF